MCCSGRKNRRRERQRERTRRKRRMEIEEREERERSKNVNEEQRVSPLKWLRFGNIRVGRGGAWGNVGMWAHTLREYI